MFAKRNTRKRQPRRLQLENLEGRQLMVGNLMDVVDQPMAAVASDDAPASYALPEVTAFDQSGPSYYIVNPRGQGESIHPSVGQVNASSNPSWQKCTGTLIDPQHVLTAAHCTEGMSNNGIVFIVGGAMYPSIQVFTHSGFKESLMGQDGNADIAVVRLAQRVSGITPTPISRVAPQVGKWMVLVGYGNTGTGETGWLGNTEGVKRFGYTPIEFVGQTTIHWTFDKPYESSTVPGDSGGPALTYVNGQYVVAGVTSGGAPREGTRAHGNYGSIAWDTRVDVYANWIDGIVNQANQQVGISTPQLTGPSGSVSTTHPTLQWNPVSGAVRYHLFVRDLTTGQNVIDSQNLTQNNFTATLVDGHSYRFWVAAITANGTRSQWSRWLEFRVQQPVAAVAPTVLAPLGTQSTQSPAFSWTPVQGAARYHLYVSDLTAGRNGIASGQVYGTSTSLNFSLTAGHNYRVWVAAVDSNGSYGPWSPSRDFTVSLWAYSRSANVEATPDPTIESPAEPISFAPPPADALLGPGASDLPTERVSERLAASRQRDLARRARTSRAVDAVHANDALALPTPARRLIRRPTSASSPAARPLPSCRPSASLGWMVTHDCDPRAPGQPSTKIELSDGWWR